MRVWFCDGSGAPFTDLQVLDVQHPGLMGQPVAYKGCVDPDVPVGRRELVGQAGDVFVPEAEWCISLAQPGTAPSEIGPETAVVVQAAIEGKWLNRLVGTLDWQPASIGNNLLADGPGFHTTLGELDAGTVVGEAVVTYRLAGNPEQTKTHRAALSDLRGHNIPSLVRAVRERAQATGEQIDAIDCSAIGHDSALANETERLPAIMAEAGIRPSDLAAPEGWQKLFSAAVRAFTDAGLAVAPGSTVTLIVRDGSDSVRGQADLLWRSAS